MYVHYIAAIFELVQIETGAENSPSTGGASRIKVVIGARTWRKHWVRVVQPSCWMLPRVATHQSAGDTLTRTIR